MTSIIDVDIVLDTEPERLLKTETYLKSQKKPRTLRAREVAITCR